MLEALTSSRDWHQSDLKLWSIFSGVHLLFPSIFHSLFSLPFRSRGVGKCELVSRMRDFRPRHTVEKGKQREAGEIREEDQESAAVT